MDREIKAAIVAVFGMALTLLFAVIGFRVITPSVLEAHFEGSTLVAVIVGLSLAAAIIAFTTFWVRLVGRLVQDIQPQADSHEEDGQ